MVPLARALAGASGLHAPGADEWSLGFCFRRNEGGQSHHRRAGLAAELALRRWALILLINLHGFPLFAAK